MLKSNNQAILQIINIMSRRPRQKRRTGKKMAQEIAQGTQGKKVIITVVVANVLLIILLYFSFKSFAN
jgi:predicted RND superfamily exporter protein